MTQAAPVSGRKRTLADGALAGPELALAEACNVLRRQERSGQLSRFEAAFAYVDLLELDMALFPFAPFAERIWALRENLTSYDAWYVALAEALDCPLPLWISAQSRDWPSVPGANHARRFVKRTCVLSDL